MKILFLVDQLYKCGGLERVLSHKLEYLSQYYPKIDIFICTNEQKNKKLFFNIPQSIKCFDLDINYNHNISLFKAENLKKTIPHYFKLNKYISNIKPDVIVHCGFGYDFYFLPLIASRGAKLIKENHSSRFFNTSSKFSLKYFFEKKYTTNVFLSNEEQQLSKLANSDVVPNPAVKLDFRIEIKNKKPVIIAAGRIAPVKGFEQLIHSWSLIANNHDGWQVHIYGDGDHDYINELNDLIHERCVDKSFFISPAVNDIQKKIAESSIYAMTSITECFPMVLLEAMQCKTAIIAFDCPTGPRNIINKDTGLLIENTNVEKFSEQLSSLISVPAARSNLEENAIEYVKTLSIRNIMKKWLEIYGYSCD
jgi:glycosyltransferase involved in cell wall biosynthesis